MDPSASKIRDGEKGERRLTAAGSFNPLKKANLVVSAGVVESRAEIASMTT